MTTIENVTIYKCDFCKKELKRKHAMNNHEKQCNCNPENFKACTNGCVFLEKEKIVLYFETYHHIDHGEEYREVEKEVFKCTKFDKLMYPYSIEKRGLPDRYPSTFEEQEAMPKTCEGFSNETDFGLIFSNNNLFKI